MTEQCKPYQKKIEHLKLQKLALLESNAQLRDENKELKAGVEELIHLLADEVQKNGDLLSENNSLRKKLMIYEKEMKR